ncbi:MAG: arginine repressor [Oscillospiraceae bacterium]|nr:hypothetical protein [[Eubacterium] saphenum]
MDKKRRQTAIIEIITENEVETQGELSRLLSERGINATQATLSRDINELHITKCESESGVNRYFSGISTVPVEFSDIFAQSVLSVDYAMNTVVLKCHAGLADAACKVVDDRQLESVIGTIAGDDTVFILTKTENHAKALCVRLKQMMKR